MSSEFFFGTRAFLDLIPENIKDAGEEFGYNWLAGKYVEDIQLAGKALFLLTGTLFLATIVALLETKEYIQGRRPKSY